MFIRLRRFLRKPAAYGALFLTYVGIIASVAYAAAVGGASQSSVQRESKRADAALIVTARQAVRDGCEFDNQRTKELRGVLQRSINSQRALKSKGAIPPDLYRENIRATQKSLQSISFRNCDAAAAKLSSQPANER